MTQQRFSPKLRLNKQMSFSTANRRWIGLVLLVLFLGAQVHFLSDLDSGQAGTHLCPVCSVLSFAILFALPLLFSLPVAQRIETLRSVVAVSQVIGRSISPRAPPAL